MSALWKSGTRPFLSEVDPDDVAKVQKELETARVKLAKQNATAANKQ